MSGAASFARIVLSAPGAKEADSLEFLLPLHLPKSHTVYAVVLTSEPEDRFFKKLFNASCAVVTSPELSADPI
jgi:hypothetical protein